MKNGDRRMSVMTRGPEGALVIAVLASVLPARRAAPPETLPGRAGPRLARTMRALPEGTTRPPARSPRTARGTARAGRARPPGRPCVQQHAVRRSRSVGERPHEDDEERQRSAVGRENRLGIMPRLARDGPRRAAAGPASGPPSGARRAAAGSRSPPRPGTGAARTTPRRWRRGCAPCWPRSRGG